MADLHRHTCMQHQQQQALLQDTPAAASCCCDATPLSSLLQHPSQHKPVAVVHPQELTTGSLAPSGSQAQQQQQHQRFQPRHLVPRRPSRMIRANRLISVPSIPQTALITSAAAVEVVEACYRPRPHPAAGTAVTSCDSITPSAEADTAVANDTQQQSPPGDDDDDDSCGLAKPTDTQNLTFTARDPGRTADAPVSAVDGGRQQQTLQVIPEDVAAVLHQLAAEGVLDATGPIAEGIVTPAAPVEQAAAAVAAELPEPSQQQQPRSLLQQRKQSVKHHQQQQLEERNNPVAHFHANTSSVVDNQGRQVAGLPASSAGVARGKGLQYRATQQLQEQPLMQEWQHQSINQSQLQPQSGSPLQSTGLPVGRWELQHVGGPCEGLPPQPLQLQEGSWAPQQQTVAHAELQEPKQQDPGRGQQTVDLQQAQLQHLTVVEEQQTAKLQPAVLLQQQPQQTSEVFLQQQSQQGLQAVHQTAVQQAIGERLQETQAAQPQQQLQLDSSWLVKLLQQQQLYTQCRTCCTQQPSPCGSQKQYQLRLWNLLDGSSLYCNCCCPVDAVVVGGRHKAPADAVTQALAAHKRILQQPPPPHQEAGDSQSPGPPVLLALMKTKHGIGLKLCAAKLLGLNVSDISLREAASRVFVLLHAPYGQLQFEQLATRTCSSIVAAGSQQCRHCSVTATAARYCSISCKFRATGIEGFLLQNVPTGNAVQQQQSLVPAEQPQQEAAPEQHTLQSQGRAKRAQLPQQPAELPGPPLSQQQQQQQDCQLQVSSIETRDPQPWRTQQQGPIGRHRWQPCRKGRQYMLNTVPLAAQAPCTPPALAATGVSSRIIRCASIEVVDMRDTSAGAVGPHSRQQQQQQPQQLRHVGPHRLGQQSPADSNVISAGIAGTPAAAEATAATDSVQTAAAGADDSGALAGLSGDAQQTGPAAAGATDDKIAVTCVAATSDPSAGQAAVPGNNGLGLCVPVETVRVAANVSDGSVLALAPLVRDADSLSAAASSHTAFSADASRELMTVGDPCDQAAVVSGSITGADGLGAAAVAAEAETGQDTGCNPNPSSAGACCNSLSKQVQVPAQQPPQQQQLGSSDRQLEQQTRGIQLPMESVLGQPAHISTQQQRHLLQEPLPPHQKLLQQQQNQARATGGGSELAQAIVGACATHKAGSCSPKLPQDHVSQAVDSAGGGSPAAASIGNSSQPPQQQHLHLVAQQQWQGSAEQQPKQHSQVDHAQLKHLHKRAVLAIPGAAGKVLGAAAGGRRGISREPWGPDLLGIELGCATCRCSMKGCLKCRRRARNKLAAQKQTQQVPVTLGASPPAAALRHDAGPQTNRPTTRRQQQPHKLPVTAATVSIEGQKALQDAAVTGTAADVGLQPSKRRRTQAGPAAADAAPPAAAAGAAAQQQTQQQKQQYSSRLQRRQQPSSQQQGPSRHRTGVLDTVLRLPAAPQTAQAQTVSHTAQLRYAAGTPQQSASQQQQSQQQGQPGHQQSRCLGRQQNQHLLAAAVPQPVAPRITAQQPSQLTWLSQLVQCRRSYRDCTTCNKPVRWFDVVNAGRTYCDGCCPADALRLGTRRRQPQPAGNLQQAGPLAQQQQAVLLSVATASCGKQRIWDEELHYVPVVNADDLAVLQVNYEDVRVSIRNTKEVVYLQSACAKVAAGQPCRACCKLQQHAEGPRFCSIACKLRQAGLDAFMPAAGAAPQSQQQAKPAAAVPDGAYAAAAGAGAVGATNADLAQASPSKRRRLHAAAVTAETSELQQQRSRSRTAAVVSVDPSGAPAPATVELHQQWHLAQHPEMSSRPHQQLQELAPVAGLSGLSWLTALLAQEGLQQQCPRPDCMNRVVRYFNLSSQADIYCDSCRPAGACIIGRSSLHWPSEPQVSLPLLLEVHDTCQGRRNPAMKTGVKPNDFLQLGADVSGIRTFRRDTGRGTYKTLLLLHGSAKCLSEHGCSSCKAIGAEGKFWYCSVSCKVREGGLQALSMNPEQHKQLLLQQQQLQQQRRVRSARAAEPVAVSRRAAKLPGLSKARASWSEAAWQQQQLAGLARLRQLQQRQQQAVSTKQAASALAADNSSRLSAASGVPPQAGQQLHGPSVDVGSSSSAAAGVAAAATGPVTAVLQLLHETGAPNAAIWQAWMDSHPNPGHVQLFCHVARGMEDGNGGFAGRELVQQHMLGTQVDAKWGDASLVEAYIDCLVEILHRCNVLNTHPATAASMQQPAGSKAVDMPEAAEKPGAAGVCIDSRATPDSSTGEVSASHTAVALPGSAAQQGSAAPAGQHIRQQQQQDDHEHSGLHSVSSKAAAVGSALDDTAELLGTATSPVKQPSAAAATPATVAAAPGSEGAVLGPDAGLRHILLASGSDIPVKLLPAGELPAGVTLYGSYNYPQQHVKDLKEVMFEGMVDAGFSEAEAQKWASCLVPHHQWLCISAEHALVLVSMRDEILKVADAVGSVWKKANGDIAADEFVIMTALRVAGCIRRFKACRTAHDVQHLEPGVAADCTPTQVMYPIPQLWTKFLQQRGQLAPAADADNVTAAEAQAYDFSPTNLLRASFVAHKHPVTWSSINDVVWCEDEQQEIVYATNLSLTDLVAVAVERGCLALRKVDCRAFDTGAHELLGLLNRVWAGSAPKTRRLKPVKIVDKDDIESEEIEEP